MPALHPIIADITEIIIKRSQASRACYLARMDNQKQAGVMRDQVSCTNLVHSYAACGTQDKETLKHPIKANIGIVSAYNDMLSAHQPFETFPSIIKEAARAQGCAAQFAGGVPAMCDGVTQGQAGMELSLFSRDVIAMATAVSLSHNVFDGFLCLGICDKIVPGLLIGALSFGHLPAIFVPGGPMPSGLPNSEKARVRQLFAEGKVTREALLEAESESYHSAGTCTFYGTANSNQMLMEIMGLHLPGSAFVNPNTPLRDALTYEAGTRITKLTALSENYTPLSEVITEKSIVNGIIGLLATGGSTNHTLHLVAIAKAAGIHINWDDFDALSKVIPLMTSIYPTGKADVNHFHAAGGMGNLIRSLLDAGLLHEDVTTVAGKGLRHYTQEPFMNNGALQWRESPLESSDLSTLRPANTPFEKEGGISLLEGNLGRAVIKTSAVKPEHRAVTAPALIFSSQEEFLEAFARGELHRDFVAVLWFQGPEANGMPELHKLMPSLSVLQDLGYKVALVTDGRLSGASGKIPAAIHVCPEAHAGGTLSKLYNDDVITLDSDKGILKVHVPDAELNKRPSIFIGLSEHQYGVGRELFQNFRNNVSTAEEGAHTFGDIYDSQ